MKERKDNTVDGILEQILNELKEIKTYLKDFNPNMTQEKMTYSVKETLSTQEAADYLGISYFTILKTDIPYSNIGKLRIYRRSTLNTWMTEQELKANSSSDNNNYGKLRKVKE